ncbi:chromatin assembly factor 1, subunit B, putative [Acanthamoeba castellanii str. Neff]|uniref:Chromatin assembly factor 1, subunit B, putative n=1 Tax=Acanthamoeba castellanii (strain ATCC 30010 / Neff) TaxID=1257118 RepID=L8GHF4_ACACF|nr:chromatin assembly factor 1, subunit B, putative [Acanthamoeba castellanii str. Neff]ELR12515.1 chromatin assembly factor 1, subunit B, putative [Acanthamoeba castellanii str. Neff]
MKVKTVLIAWHGREPVYSIDFHSSGRIATGGADNCVNIWKVAAAMDGDVQVEFQANLTRHQKAVNAVRFSPNDGTVMVWQFVSEGAVAPAFGEETEIVNKETWNVVRLLSSDRTVRIYKAARSQPAVKKDTAQEESGVSVPATAPSPAKVVYSKLVTANVISSAPGLEAKAASGPVQTHKQKLFLDETTPSFFRRLAWSLDGSLLVTPMGQFYATSGPSSASSSSSSVPMPDDKENVAPEHLPSNCLYVFTRGVLNRPALCLPCGPKPAVAVRFSPQIYKLRPTETTPTFKLDYRMVFAVATFDSVLVYDTQHGYPLCHITGLHYASQTDLSWASDGQMLAVTSTDGYCTFISFAADELGEPIPSCDRAQLLNPPAVLP